MAKVGYLRISCTDQNEARQIKKLEEIGCKKVFKDKSTGRNTDRPGLSSLFEYLREGDTLIVDSFFRFSRSTVELITMVERIKDMGVEFVSLKENIDTKTPAGKMFLTFMAGVAEFELENSRMRALEGIAIAKEQGKYANRGLKIDDKFVTVYERWKAGEIKAVEAHKELGICRASFYNLKNKYEAEGVQIERI